MPKNLAALILELEKDCKGLTDLTFCYFFDGGIGYCYNEDVEYTEEDLEDFATECAIEDVLDDAPWLFRLDKGKVTEVKRIK